MPVRFATRLGGVLLVCLVAASTLAAEDPPRERLEKSRRHQEWAQIKAPGGRTVRAFVVFPEVEKPATAVVVIHENQGLTDWVRGVADQLAEAGYVAVAPDLLSQAGPDRGGTESFSDRDAARKAIYALPEAQVLSDLDATVEHARSMSAANGRVAVAGFCWGGGQAFRYATHGRRIAAAFVFYGAAPSDPQTLAKIEVPVYGFYGGKDFRITGQAPKTAEAMKQAGKRFEPVIYEGAGHGFMRSGEEASGPESGARIAQSQTGLRTCGTKHEPGCFQRC